MAKISLKKDYMDGNVLYGKDLNPNFETIETTINANDDEQSETNASVNEAITQLSSDMSQAKTDISGLQEDVADLGTAVLDIPTKTSELENDSGFVTEAAIPTKISQLENDDNTVKDADYVHTDNNYTSEDKSKLDSLNNYELPIASTSTLGGIKLGEGLEVEVDGTVNVTGGGGSGENGATFTPSVDDSGNLSWTNDKGLPNPDPVNIKGPKGDTGATGEQGETGPQGPQGETGATGAAGADGLDSLSYTGGVQNSSIEPNPNQTYLNLALNKFNRTPVVGDTHFVYMTYNSNSYLVTFEITQVNDDYARSHAIAVLNTTGAKGSTGVQGPQGDPGPAGADGVTPTIGENGNWYLGETDTGKPSRGEQGPKGNTGDQGPQGLPGPTGPGVPTGGTTGQVLSKNSDDDYDTIWKDVASGSANLIELVGTKEEPIDIRYLVEPGIYQIKGYVSYFPTGINVSTGSSVNEVVATSSAFDTSYNPIMAFVNINLDSKSMRANRLFIREVNMSPVLYSHVGNVNKDSSGKNYINANVLAWTVLTSTSSGSLSTGNNLMTSYAVSNMIKTATGITSTNNLDDLQTTNKSSLIAAINELKARIDDLETSI